MGGVLWVVWHCQYAALWELNVVLVLVRVSVPFFIGYLLKGLSFLPKNSDEDLVQPERPMDRASLIGLLVGTGLRCGQAEMDVVYLGLIHHQGDMNLSDVAVPVLVQRFSQLDQPNVFGLCVGPAGTGEAHLGDDYAFVQVRVLKYLGEVPNYR